MFGVDSSQIRGCACLLLLLFQLDVKANNKEEEDDEEEEQVAIRFSQSWKGLFEHLILDTS